MLRLLTRPLALLAVALGLGGAFAGCASLDEWQRQAIFNPARDNPRWFSEPIQGTEEYDLALPNGHQVHAWHIAQAKNPADAPTVLYLHGARWNMNGSVFRIARWHELGFNVLAVDYRGFGKSTELLPSEETAADDARLAFEELKRRQPDPSRRYLYGHSLGGALAIDLASRELKADPDAVAGVIIESTFTSIPDVVRGMKWGWVPGIGLAVTQPFDAVSKIRDVRAPLLVLHGTADSVVPHTMADTLYAAAGSREKTLVKIEGGTHSGSSRTGGSVYRDAVLAFVRQTGSTTTADAR
jgi:alpha-beta hydrolase superfamily lysophospholipase